MNNKKKWKYGMFGLVFTVICGCGGSIRKGKTEQQMDDVISNGFICETEQGIIFSGNTEMAYYYDYQTEQTLPLCAKANCRHESETDCMAKKLTSVAFLPVIYKNDLYYLNLNDDHSRWDFYRSNIDGTNEKKLAELEYETQPLNAAFHEDKVYLIGSIYGSNEQGTIQDRTELYSIDLESGVVQPLLSISYGESGDVWLDFVHIYKDSLYFQFFSREADTSYVNGYYEMNLEDGTIHFLEWTKDALIKDGKNNYILMDCNRTFETSGKEIRESAVLTYRNLDTGESEELTDLIEQGRALIVDDGCLYMEVSEGRKTGTWKFYSWETKETKTIAEVSLEMEYFFLEYAVKVKGKEQLIGEWKEAQENGEIIKGHYMISLEDFLEGKESYQLLCQVN